MTLADHKHALAVRRIAVAPPQRWLAVRWDVCDGEIRGVLEWRIADDPAPAPRRAGVPAAVAIWHVDSAAPGGGGNIVATVAAPESRALLRTADPGAGLEHIDIPGLLSLTLHRAPASGGGNGGSGDAATTVLYARTPLIAALGARGGRADSPRCTILHTGHDGACEPAAAK